MKKNNTNIELNNILKVLLEEYIDECINKYFESIEINNIFNDDYSIDNGGVN